ncbi:MAG TPA: hypothetical protein VFF69_12565 [Phycisphaerales bacterium]|nr:hypothetical protein [Phycisphaerales bacterium]
MSRAFALCVPVVLASASLAQTGVFLLAPIGNESIRYAGPLTGDGAVVGGASRARLFDDGQAAMWSSATRDGVGLGRPGVDGLTRVTDLSDDARTALVLVTEGVDRSYFLWRDGAGYSAIAPDASWYDWAAYGLSRDGRTVAGTAFVQGEGSKAVVWRDGGAAQDLQRDPAWRSSAATVIGPDGSILGNVAHGDDETWGVRWSNGEPTELFAFPTDHHGLITAVSSDGSVYGGAAPFDDPIASKPFTWSPQGGYVELPLDDGFESGWVFDATLDGRLAVGRAAVGSGEHASVWVDGEHLLFGEYLAAQGIDSAGWEFSTLGAVSDDGRVFAGYATDPLGNSAGFVAIVPAPPALPAVLAGVLTLGRRKR